MAGYKLTLVSAVTLISAVTAVIVSFIIIPSLSHSATLLHC